MFRSRVGRRVVWEVHDTWSYKVSEGRIECEFEEENKEEYTLWVLRCVCVLVTLFMLSCAISASGERIQKQVKGRIGKLTDPGAEKKSLQRTFRKAKTEFFSFQWLKWSVSCRSLVNSDPFNNQRRQWRIQILVVSFFMLTVALLSHHWELSSKGRIKKGSNSVHLTWPAARSVPERACLAQRSKTDISLRCPCWVRWVTLGWILLHWLDRACMKSWD